MLQTQESTPPSFAVVAEGGGQKGIFTAGVLDAFIEQKFWPFGLKVGVSAGAQNLAAYCTRSGQYASQAIQKLTTTQTFFRPAKFFTGGNVIDLDWYFDQVQEAGALRFPSDLTYLDVDANFHAVATDADSLEPIYLATCKQNLFKHLKASSAIPFLYRPGVEIDGRCLIDGGVSDPLPVHWAYEQGARRILVIRTMQAHFDGQSPLLERLRPLLGRIRQSPRMYEMYLCYQQRYAEAIEFIRHPPEDLEVMEIAPPENLRSMVLGSPPHVLRHDYLIGMREGRKFLRHWNRSQRLSA